MEHIAGSTKLTNGWLQPMSELIAAINGVEPGELVWPYERYAAHHHLGVPIWAEDGGLWGDAFRLVHNGLPQTRYGFIHRDLHPGNILWEEGQVVAVIDWLSGCIGPLALDVSHCRANLAMDLGLDIADSFLSAYLERVPAGTWHPAWDVADAVDFMPFWLGQEAVDKWQWDERPAAVTRARFEQYLRAAMVAVEKIR
jgi:hypothetical protein